jgi:hypothetical protein
MADETKTNPIDSGAKNRRAFVKTAAQVAVTAPAVVMLLSATTKPASAQAVRYAINTGNTGDNAFFDDTTPNGQAGSDDSVQGDDFGFPPNGGPNSPT